MIISNQGQGFLSHFILVLYRLRYQVSVYRTIDPLVSFFDEINESKQNGPRWDAAFCGVKSGAIMSHKKDAMHAY